MKKVFIVLMLLLFLVGYGCMSNFERKEKIREHFEGIPVIIRELPYHYRNYIVKDPDCVIWWVQGSLFSGIVIDAEKLYDCSEKRGNNGSNN